MIFHFPFFICHFRGRVIKASMLLLMGETQMTQCNDDQLLGGKGMANEK